MGESKFEYFSETVVPGLLILSNEEGNENKEIVGYIVYPPTYMCKCMEKLGNKNGFFKRCIFSLIWPISCCFCVLSCINDGYQVPVYVSKSITV
jgi:hypothetical protein